MNISYSMLKAAPICAAKNDTRYYLNSVYLEPVKAGTLVVSTDGHRMFIGLSEGDKINAAIIVPLNVVSRATKEHGVLYKGRAGDFPIVLAAAPGDEHSLGGIPFEPLEGTYPNLRHPIPDRVSAKPGYYNPVYMLEAHEALAIADGKPFNKSQPGNSITYQNGMEAAAVVESVDCKAIVVVMPLHINGLSKDPAPQKLSLGWLNKPTKKKRPRAGQRKHNQRKGK